MSKPKLQLEQVYATEAQAVFAFIGRMGVKEPEDAVHDTFVTALHRAHTYDGSYPVRSWLLGIAFRVAVARLRKSSEQLVDALPDRATEAADPERLTEARRALAKVQQVLVRMSDELGTTFVQHELQGVPVAELARTLGVPPATVYSRIRLAREAFRAALAETKEQP